MDGAKESADEVMPRIHAALAIREEAAAIGEGRHQLAPMNYGEKALRVLQGDVPIDLGATDLDIADRTGRGRFDADLGLEDE